MPRIAILPGDGIGPEITAEVIMILEVLRSRGAALEWRTFDYSADSYLKTGKAMPDGAFEELSSFDAIFLGAFGDPRVPDSAHARDILLGLRFGLDLYVNLRPAKLMLDRLTPLKGMTLGDIDLVVVRENTEGAYVGAGGFLRRNTPEEIAIQEAVATRRGVERILRYAFEYARTRRRKKLAMADKHNALRFVSDLWYRLFQQVSADYPDVEARHFFIDNMCYQFVCDPSQFDVVVTGNLFGDILSDLGAALAGGLGLAPSANINPETGRGLFEPVHGSAPEIAGRGVANPAAGILSLAMMLDFLGMTDAAQSVESAVNSCILDGQVTRDLGGTLGTSAAGDAVRRTILYGEN